jgi:O-antigen/teichoic acid export membrane protein
MFPAFSTALVNDRARAGRLFERTNNYIFISLFPLVLVIVTLASEGLSTWLGSEFADNSTTVLQVLAVGVFLNSQAQVPFGMVQGAGRPDLTAKLHALELVFYLPILWLLLDAYGIVGAAIAWAARMAVDAVLLYLLAGILLPEASRFTLRAALAIATAFLALGLGAIISGLAVKALFLLIVLSLFGVVAWFGILRSEERTMIRRRLNTLPLFS